MSQTTAKQADTNGKNPPVAKVRVGLITASIWENTNNRGTLPRRYI
jgi:hypothetical protein